MIPQPLPVVGRHGQDRPVQEAAATQGDQEPAHELVGVGDLPVVSVIEPLVGRERVVGRVGLVEVKEGEKAAPILSQDPPSERIHRHRPVPSLGGQRRLGGVDLEGVVVEVEAPRDPRRRAQHEGRDRPPRGPARLPEAGGQRGVVGGEGEAHVVPDAVVRRQQTSEERRVGGQGQRAVAVDVLEHNSLSAQGVEVGGRALAVAVEGQVIGAQGVDRDQDYGSVPVGADNSPAAGQEEPGEQEGAGPSHCPTRAMSRASSATGARRR